MGKGSESDDDADDAYYSHKSIRGQSTTATPRPLRGIWVVDRARPRTPSTRHPARSAPRDPSRRRMESCMREESRRAHPVERRAESSASEAEDWRNENLDASDGDDDATGPGARESSDADPASPDASDREEDDDDVAEDEDDCDGAADASGRKKRSACKERVNKRCAAPGDSPRKDFSRARDVEADIRALMRGDRDAVDGIGSTPLPPPARETSPGRGSRGAARFPPCGACLFANIANADMCPDCSRFYDETIAGAREQADAVLARNEASAAVSMTEASRDREAFALGCFWPRLVRGSAAISVHPTLAALMSLDFPNACIEVDHEAMSKISTVLTLLHASESATGGAAGARPKRAALPAPPEHPEPPPPAVPETRAIAGALPRPDGPCGGSGCAVLPLVSRGTALASVASGSVARPSDVAAHLDRRARLTEDDFVRLFRERFEDPVAGGSGAVDVAAKRGPECLTFVATRECEPTVDVAFISAQASMIFFTDCDCPASGADAARPDRGSRRGGACGARGPRRKRPRNCAADGAAPSPAACGGGGGGRTRAKGRFCEPADGASFVRRFAQFFAEHDRLAQEQRSPPPD